MRACAILNTIAGLALLTLVAFAGCGGKPTEPATPETVDTKAQPSDTSGSEPGDTPAGEDKAPAGGEEGKGGEPEDTETRTTEVIHKQVQDNRKPIRACFDAAKKELPDLAGTMTITFVLDPEGKVKSAELNQERSEIKAPSVVNCAIAELKKFKFPPSSRGMETTVNYPFSFNKK